MSDNQKPLKDWTLGEAEEYCRSQRKCEECIFFKNSFHGCLLLKTIPCDWDLSEKPKYSKEDIKKIKAINVLYPEAEYIYVCSLSGENSVHITWEGVLISAEIKFNSLERNKRLNINEVLESEDSQ